MPAAPWRRLWAEWRRPLTIGVGGAVGFRLIVTWIALVSGDGVVFPHIVARHPSTLTSILAKWDGGYYLSLAAHGYPGHAATAAAQTSRPRLLRVRAALPRAGAHRPRHHGHRLRDEQRAREHRRVGRRPGGAVEARRPRGRSPGGRRGLRDAAGLAERLLWTALRLSWRYIESFEAEAAKLYATAMDTEEVRRFAHKLVDVEGAESAASTRNRRERAEGIVKLWTSSPTIAPIAGTRWAAYNAVTEYFDHVAPVRGARTTSEASATRALRSVSAGNMAVATSSSSAGWVVANRSANRGANEKGFTTGFAICGRVSLARCWRSTEVRDRQPRLRIWPSGNCRTAPTRPDLFDGGRAPCHWIAAFGTRAPPPFPESVCLPAARLTSTSNDPPEPIDDRRFGLRTGFNSK